MFVSCYIKIMTMIGICWACLSVGVLAQTSCTTLAIPIMREEAPPTQYAKFCEKHPTECALSGRAVLHSDPRLNNLLFTVNKTVNVEVELVPDPDRGVEEDWDFPQNCEGDCEDFALEKRHRLVEAGLPSASLTMAIVHNKIQFFPHAVLLVETDTGTWVLDNLYDEVMCWDAVPYRYERREQPDGQWSRFALF